MLLPRAAAHPAELVLARRVLAGHVVAAAILLDARLALWAGLRVRDEPIVRLRVVAALDEPLL